MEIIFILNTLWYDLFTISIICSNLALVNHLAHLVHHQPQQHLSFPIIIGKCMDNNLQMTQKLENVEQKMKTVKMNKLLKMFILKLYPVWPVNAFFHHSSLLFSSLSSPDKQSWRNAYEAEQSSLKLNFALLIASEELQAKLGQSKLIRKHEPFQ